MKKIIYGMLLCLFAAACAKKSTITSPATIAKANTASIVKPAGYNYPKDSAFKLLSWNVEHFIDSYDDPYIDNGRENNPPANMPRRVSLFVQALKKADADVVVLQEFESAKFLKKLAEDSLSGMGYLYFADIPSHNWYMNVVVMSRFPMGVIAGYGSATTALPGFLTKEGKAETQNQINTRMWSIDVFPSAEYSFLLTGVHLKAGRTNRDVAMRKGQIALLKETFNRHLSLDPAKNMVLAGDHNATPESEEIALLTKDKALMNPFVDTIDPTILSHPANSPNRRLDYILINENMKPEVLDGGAQVTRFFAPDTMRVISDHLPIVARFVKKDKKAVMPHQ